MMTKTHDDQCEDARSWTAKYWKENETKCTECNRIIDAAGQCDCVLDPIWGDKANRRCQPTC